MSVTAMAKLEYGARELGLRLTPEQLTSFQRYYEELVKWNQRFNMTTVVVTHELASVFKIADRIAMLKYAIGSIGLIYENDLRFCEQF